MKKLNETDTSKLALNIETIRTLTPEDLLDANGGAAPASSAAIICSACPNCCPSVDSPA